MGERAATPWVKFGDSGNRLQATWSSPDKGLGGFWEELEKAESASDILKSSSVKIRKRSLRSAERNILNDVGIKDDTSQQDVHVDSKELLSQKSTESEKQQRGLLGGALDALAREPTRLGTEAVAISGSHS
ncbi:hypothetical protein KI688_005875 [Linnemannia hyalina]|uniref:Uncharacterized protein n=1 Tax=Linnemannia hyalina TaxID=64524 RepID=A0A9P7Y3Y2_9FUNG|nr:hypothetical protein KI688_005875 [Linnemannia hyalina]